MTGAFDLGMTDTIAGSVPRGLPRPIAWLGALRSPREAPRWRQRTPFWVGVSAPLPPHYYAPQTATIRANPQTATIRAEFSDCYHRTPPEWDCPPQLPGIPWPHGSLARGKCARVLGGRADASVARTLQ